MKKINIENPKKQRAKRYLIFSIIILIVCGLMIYNAITNNKSLIEDNFDITEGIVDSYELIENEYLFSIKSLTEEQKIITVTLNKEVISTLPIINDNLEIGDKIKLVYDLDTKDIYKVVINDELLYDRLDEAIKSNNRLIIFYIIVAVLMLAYLVWNIINFVKEPALKELDYIEYIITNNRAVTNAMLMKDSKSIQLIRKEKLINKCMFIVMIIVLFGSILIKSVVQNKIILFVVAVLIICGMITIMIISKPRFYSKNLNLFVQDYLNYMINGESREERTIFFKKEGLKVISNEQTFFFDYHELNLYTVGVYSKTNAPVNIFICSQLPEKEEYKDIQDFIIPLSKDIYQDIRDNSIYIIGLEEVINNLYEESKTSIQNVKEGFFVKYYNK